MTTYMTASELVHAFWRQMATNDFDSLDVMVASSLVVEWPQSGERIRGVRAFAQMNREYPAHGPWKFKLNHVIGNDGEAVSDVSVTDGAQTARAISFFTIENGMIVRIVEFWPEAFEPPANRAHLVEKT